jgi:hypothetical protein
MPVNPKAPAMRAIMRKVRIQLSMGVMCLRIVVAVGKNRREVARLMIV